MDVLATIRDIAIIVLAQAVIITFGGGIFNVEPLSVTDWLWITCASASVLVFAELSRWLRLLLE